MSEVLNVSMQYTPPGGALNSGTMSLQKLSSSNAQNAGYLDVPDATAASTAFTVPFGSIGTGAKALVVHNTLSNPLDVSINGTLFGQISAGGMIMIGVGDTAPTANPVLSMTLTTTVLQSGLGQIAYYVFGD